MLLLVGYDLEKPVNYADTLGAALEECGLHRGDSMNVPYGPRFVDTDKTPRQVVQTILRRLGPGRKDELLVLAVDQEGTWAERAVDPEKVAWLARKNRLGPESHEPILALAYTLHGAGRKDYQTLLRDLEALPIFRSAGYCHPLHALSFLATDRTAWAVRDEVAKSLPNRKGKQQPDELLVFPVGREGAQHGLSPASLQWFHDLGIHLTEVARAA